ncbi:MAG: 4Fe-4S dicluster domain-containing protein [Comamonadaceae bacterium]|nr:MAG: 4Fe-4S dicluster domain-containing protein [Comamonadaceae bacterium]
MAYVITQRCCNDASCIPVCPVDCIRPTPDQPEFKTAEHLYIDPQTCIDCGACMDACPVGAIFPEDDLVESLARFKDINADYFERHPLEPSLHVPPLTVRPPKELGVLRVAIVGSGPSACYAAEELLRRADVEVEMFERLPTPWGLVRAGVAPDHQGTKGVTEIFEAEFQRDAFQYYLNVEVGTHIAHDELLAHHHAVIYAVGAKTDRHLDIPGESLPGSHSATEFVAWYNGNPDHADAEFDLSGDRAVIVGNGNVALDVARILLVGSEQLGETDIADHALEELRKSNIREVVLIGRRGPVQAAYSSPEFLALGHLSGIDVVVDEKDLELDPVSQVVLEDPEVEPSLALKVALAREYANRPLDPSHKRIVFRYLASPVELIGTDRVGAVRIAKNELVATDGAVNAVTTDNTETLDTSLVLRSIGYRGEPVSDLPFDERSGTIPNEGGRVLNGSDSLTGVYVTGWIKRGPRGVIGTNKIDAQETVNHLLDDFIAGTLKAPAHDRGSLLALVQQRQPDALDRDAWRAIDTTEREQGKTAGRPRVKFTSVAKMIATARG